MADNLQATPRNELLGLLSDAMYGGLDWMKDPQRTQQMQGLAGLLESTGIPKTTQRLAYGEPLTNIGQANVPLLKPETAEAAMNLAPFAPVAGKAAKAYARMAGEEINAAMMGERGGLLGAVTPQPLYAMPNDIFKLSKQEFLGKPKITKNTNAADLKPLELNTLKNVEPQPFMGGKYQIKMNEDGAVVFDKGKPIASYNFGDTLVVDKPYRKSGIAQELVYSWRTSFPAPAVATERTKASQAIQEKVWERIQNEKQSVPQSFTYPQQAALDLAQKRAALPIEQGGLGLPANNTAMDRAKAMGFEDAYHGTNGDVTQLTPGFPTQNSNAFGTFEIERHAIFTSPEARLANEFAVDKPNGSVMPLMVRKGNSLNWENGIDQKSLDILEKFGIHPQNLDWLPADESWQAFDGDLGKKVSNTLRSNGYDSVRLKEMRRSDEGLSKSTAHLEPSLIRSRFAAFDPFRKDIATATAMGVALPDLLAAEPTPQNQSSGLLYPYP